MKKAIKASANTFQHTLMQFDLCVMFKMKALKVTTATSVLLHVVLICGITTSAVQSLVYCPPETKCLNCVNGVCMKCTSGFYLGITACLTCTNCSLLEGPPQYAATPCAVDVDSDTQCQPCNMSCGPDFYQTATCTSIANIQCAACGCPVGSYKTSTSGPCGGFSNFDCTTCTNCSLLEGPPQYAATPCAVDSDTQCQPCGCPVGSYKTSTSRPCEGTSNFDCTNCTTTDCPIGQYESAKCSTTADRNCSLCSTGCPTGYYKTFDCTPTKDIVCALCNIRCPTGYYKTFDCTTTKDTVCTLCTPCLNGLVETSPCTPTSDRVCGQPTTPKPTLLQICQNKFAQQGSVGLSCWRVLCKNVKSLRRSGFCRKKKRVVRPPIGRPTFG